VRSPAFFFFFANGTVKVLIHFQKTGKEQ